MSRSPRDSPRNHASIRARIASTPLAIEVNSLEGILALLDDRAAGVRPSNDDLDALRASEPYGAARGNTNAAQAKRVAIAGLYGPMMSYGESLQAVSGASSTREFAAIVRRAADDPSIAEIILDIDSPGGSVTSVDTAAEAVRYAASRKPVTALSEGMMASAAYWVASQATRVVASANAMVGSISVIYTHADRSAANEAAGVRYTYLTTGDKKAMGNSSEPLSDAARVELMRTAQAYHDAFVADVAAGRGISPERVQSEWADGRVETGLIAKALGLIDDVGTLASILDGITNPPIKPRGVNAVKLSDIKAILEGAPRAGAETDQPEGERTITLSETVALEMATSIGAAETATTEQINALTAERDEASETARVTHLEAVAANAVRDAALPPVSAESDAAFLATVQTAAITAGADEVQTTITAMIADRRELIGARTSDNHPGIPKKAAGTSDTVRELRRIRGTLGLN